MVNKIRHVILPGSLVVQTVYCWNCFYKAQFLAYDDNYGLMIHALIISLVVLITIGLLRYYRARWIRFDLYVFVIWLIIGSPVTFSIAAIYYQSIFHATLAT